jgi:hypothetical protein
MKKLLLTMSLVLTAALLSTVFASGTDPRTEKAFAREFAGAENVKWTNLTEGYQKASFVLAGTRVEAYFSSDAELLGTVRNLLYGQLPLVVMQSVNSRFANAVIIEVTEIANNDGTHYKVRVEQQDKSYNVNVSSSGDVTEVKKIRAKKS